MSPNLKGVRSLAVYGRRQVENLYYGAGWDTEYTRDVWRLRNLGLDGHGAAHVRFDGIPQPWLRELAKRWTRWRLSTGLGAPQAITGTRSLARLGRFLDQAAVAGISQVDRRVLEGYLAELSTLSISHRRRLIGDAGTFFQAVRQHHWDDMLPADAMFYREDFPRLPQRLPRALAENVMAQVEDPANLARCPQPEVRLITVILIRCGLRAGDALALPRQDCITRDSDGAPYLRYQALPWHRSKHGASTAADWSKPICKNVP